MASQIQKRILVTMGLVNLGNSNEFTIMELAEKIISLTDSSSKIIYRSFPKDDPKQRQPDISLAIKNLGWEPEIELEEGPERTICYFEEQ